MKNLCLTFAAALSFLAMGCASNQQKAMETIKKGQMEVIELDGFKLHVYCTLDALSDVSFIFEGKDSLVTLEHPLFNENISEFNAYIKALGKPVEKIIANYHTGGFMDLHDHDVVMVEGMPEFEQSPVYSGMLGGFSQAFGDSIDMRPHGETEIVKFSETKTWAGIDFTFSRGASSDFPAASINAGGQVYYTHWTPAQTHMSHLQLVCADALEAEIAETQNALNSGCSVFIGSHGGRGTKADMEFRLAYLQKAKYLRESCETAQDWAEGMKAAYPSIPGDDGLAILAETLYK